MHINKKAAEIFSSFFIYSGRSKTVMGGGR